MWGVAFIISIIHFNLNSIIMTVTITKKNHEITIDSNLFTLRVDASRGSDAFYQLRFFLRNSLPAELLDDIEPMLEQYDVYARKFSAMLECFSGMDYSMTIVIEDGKIHFRDIRQEDGSIDVVKLFEVIRDFDEPSDEVDPITRLVEVHTNVTTHDMYDVNHLYQLIPSSMRHKNSGFFEEAYSRTSGRNVFQGDEAIAFMKDYGVSLIIVHPQSV